MHKSLIYESEINRVPMFHVSNPQNQRQADTSFMDKRENFCEHMDVKNFTIKFN